jgi:hypothetical protein
LLARMPVRRDCDGGGGHVRSSAESLRQFYAGESATNAIRGRAVVLMTAAARKSRAAA